MKIRKNDLVVVIAGKNKNQTGKVLRTLAKKDRVVVEGVNKVKRHMRATKERPGKILGFEAPMHISNVMLVDPKTKKRSRIGFTRDAKGVKQRIAKKSKTSI